MSGDNFDQALFEAMRLPGPDRVEASAQRSREIYAEHGDDTGAWIVSGTAFAYNRFMQVQRQRLALVAALDAAEHAAADARKAFRELGNLIDRDLLPYLGHNAVIETALSTITLAVAGAKYHAPDPDALEGALDHLED